jgi:hypothetical protein|tara:strand:- start:19 stop:645 length:627 start_codon:yes stop_codon:yes gene_type:complete
MSFKEKGYEICKEAVSKELASFCYRYFLLKKDAYYYMRSKDYLSPYETIFGFHGDTQIPNSYNSYADVAMETLSTTMLPFLSKQINVDLHQQYTYTRCYGYGDILERHKDRPECEISATLNLGGDPWPIFIDETGGIDNKGISMLLQPGDLMIYRGCDLQHWREPFEGDKAVQVFLHYNDKNGPFKNLCRKFDEKEMLGIPSDFKNKL